MFVLQSTMDRLQWRTFDVMADLYPSETDTLQLLDRLKIEIPEAAQRARTVGTWIWIEFTVPPLQAVRTKLKRLGFHWNARRKCWQHPGIQRVLRDEASRASPQSDYPRTDRIVLRRKVGTISAKEFKVISLRECPLPEEMQICDCPEKVAAYWHQHIASSSYFNPDCECFVVLILNTRKRIRGHQLLTIGTLDSVLVHPREVFRGAIIAGAAAMVLAHNHPSGESEPSEADIRVTRDLIRAGQLMRIEVLDHVIIGKPSSCSLRERGYFCS